MITRLSLFLTLFNMLFQQVGCVWARIWVGIQQGQLTWPKGCSVPDDLLLSNKNCKGGCLPGSSCSEIGWTYICHWKWWVITFASSTPPFLHLLNCPCLGFEFSCLCSSCSLPQSWWGWGAESQGEAVWMLCCWSVSTHHDDIYAIQVLNTYDNIVNQILIILYSGHATTYGSVLINCFRQIYLQGLLSWCFWDMPAHWLTGWFNYLCICPALPLGVSRYSHIRWV